MFGFVHELQIICGISQYTVSTNIIALQMVCLIINEDILYIVKSVFAKYDLIEFGGFLFEFEKNGNLTIFNC